MEEDEADTDDEGGEEDDDAAAAVDATTVLAGAVTPPRMIGGFEVEIQLMLNHPNVVVVFFASIYDIYRLLMVCPNKWVLRYLTTRIIFFLSVYGTLLVIKTNKNLKLNGQYIRMRLVLCNFCILSRLYNKKKQPPQRNDAIIFRSALVERERENTR